MELPQQTLILTSCSQVRK